MNTQIWLLAGAVLGWIISIILRRSYPVQLFNVLVGLVGALATGTLVVPMFHLSTIRLGIFSLPALMISLAGSVILLAVVNIFSKENKIKEKVIERRWEQVSNKICTRWEKLNQEDIAKINGNYRRFIEIIQARYGCTYREAENQIQSYLKAVLAGSKHSFRYDQV